MSKLTPLETISNLGGNPTSAQNAINTNSQSITTAFNNTLSRDGSTPNEMLASLDMNSNRIINMADGVNPQDGVTVSQLEGVFSSGLLDGDKGDITVSSGASAFSINAGAVTTTELGGDITTAGKALLDDADAAAQRITLGLGTAAQAAFGDFAPVAHTHPSSQITDYLEVFQDTLGQYLVAGNGIQVDYDDTSGQTTVTNINSGNIQDHGLLMGLADDDHTQYLRTDGTRELTGNWSVGDFTLNNVGLLELSEIADPGLATADKAWLHAEDVAGFTQIHHNDSTRKWAVLQDQYIVCRNMSGGAVTVGQVVEVSGSTGQRPEIVLADADTHSHTIGIVADAALNTEYTRVVVHGLLTKIDTSAWAAGTVLYLSSTAGALSSTAPDHPAADQTVAICIYQHAVNGILFVKVHEDTRHGDGSWHDAFTIGSSLTDRAVLDITGSALTASRTFKFPDASGTFPLADATQTITGAWNFTTAPTISSNTIWHAGNDGAGSTLDADKLDGYNTTASGGRWNCVPTVFTDGVMEIGKYLDFHETSASVGDYDYRFTISGGELFLSGPVGGEVRFSDGYLLLSNAGECNLWMYDSTAATNEKYWRLVSSGGNLYLQSWSDALGDARLALQCDRNGYAVSQVTYGNSTDDPPHVFHGVIKPQDGIMLAGSTIFGDAVTTDTFTYNSDTLPHYGLRYYDDSNFGGMTGALTGYYGLRFFTGGGLRMSIDSSNVVMDASIVSYRTGSHFTMYENDAADTADRGLIEVNGNQLNLYGYDNSAAAWRLFLGGNITTGATTICPSGANLGFFGSGGNAKQTVTGSRGGNAALASLLTALANYGLITNSSTA